MTFLGYLLGAWGIGTLALMALVWYLRHELASARDALEAFKAAQAGQVALDQTLAAQVTKARVALAERQKAEAQDDALAASKASGDPAAAAALLNQLHQASPTAGPGPADPVPAPSRPTVP